MIRDMSASSDCVPHDEIPAQKLQCSAAVQAINEIQYLDAGLNSRGAYPTDPRVVASLGQLAKPPRVHLHGTPRQWGELESTIPPYIIELVIGFFESCSRQESTWSQTLLLSNSGSIHRKWRIDAISM